MSSQREIAVMANLLQNNDIHAEINRKHFEHNNCLAVNMIGSPGAGKTTLLERTLSHLKEKHSIAVIEGDIFTRRDADRIAQHDIPVVQINTGGGCHLDSKMVEKVLTEFQWDNLDLMIIENVGNLVCPADFDLGEEFKVVVLSVVEGDDKPAKYPVIFRNSKVAVLNKMDLLALVETDLDAMKKDIFNINPEIKIFEVSCRTGEGLQEWVQWLDEQVRQAKGKNA
ncbi:hydrogenase nickel incorporation protein HypB [Desulfitobacterium sp. LBE]|uniref:hydrogenase nickel incorporation protein HypB n=1 Tax=Desulfitobacterium sp. LBE TaxID=884086 RepID=UPI00119A3E3A|nr:hydrogenase nickel incorporation protein HypB [Desulfitobacterium sp. LBE]TWH59031.1 hydrogenase nickel incorporation protein HypB [Desulfitobacterium sp. LBE]